MEMILTMADIGHYTQDYQLLLQWSQASCQEKLQAHLSERANDPREGRYILQIEFFGDVVLPLIDQIESILPQSSCGLREGAEKNMELWQEGGREWMEANKIPSASREGVLGETGSCDEFKHLINKNVEMLESLLKNVVASHKKDTVVDRIDKEYAEEGLNLFNEVHMVIATRQAMPDDKGMTCAADLELPQDATRELRQYVSTIASGYRNSEFHNFEHASDVAMLADLLLKRIEGTEGAEGGYGITSDPLARFAVVFSALVHDVGHTRVPNSQLARANPELAATYTHRGIAEQNSIDTAWDLLMQVDRYPNLQNCLFESSGERERLHKLLINCAMATDIFDKELKAFRNSRWEKAFLEATIDHYLHHESAHYRAAIVIEHIIQASDVAHTMQTWGIYRKWNERLFLEMYGAFVEGRAEKDPSDGWYQGELWFFDNCVIPLACKLGEFGVMGVASYECLNRARENRQKWEVEGENLCRAMLEKAQQKYMSKPSTTAKTTTTFQSCPIRRSSDAGSVEEPVDSIHRHPLKNSLLLPPSTGKPKKEIIETALNMLA
jgi:hypothetical protein